MEARKVKVAVLYNNKDISADLAPYLKTATVTDNMDGVADDLSIVFEDREGLWQSTWFPDKGALLTVSVTCENWEGALDFKTQDFGLFEIDEITSSGKPSEVQIRAVSVPDNNALRGVERSKSWEKAELKEIAQDIATSAGMELYFDVAYNPVLERAEQTSQSDLSFLMQLCRDQGICLKVYKSRIVMFEAAKLEAVVPTCDIGTENCLSYSLITKVRDVYGACHVKYGNGKSKSLVEYTFAPEGKGGKALEVNEEVKTTAEAERLAKYRLREKNADEWTGSFTLMGDLRMLAGQTVRVSGYGAFDGNYIVTSATHSFSDNGYTTAVNIRRCIIGY